MNTGYAPQGLVDPEGAVMLVVLSFAQRKWCRSTEQSTDARAKREAALAFQSGGP